VAGRFLEGTLRPPQSGDVQIDVYLRDGSLASIADDVREGLSAKQKALPPKYFYDSRGSELFEQITLLPEYYPTRIEQAILDEVAEEIVEQVRPEELVELGPGSARKTNSLLDPMLEAGLGQRYVPVDVSETAVQESAGRLADEYERLTVHGIVGDFERHLDRVPRNGDRRLMAFLGGTIGNFDRQQRQTMLRKLRAQLGPEDRLLVGTDLVKDRSRLEAAYNDSAGVTAEFNRNVLNVINANLDGDLEPERFDHVALYDERRQWIEMSLRATGSHSARIEELDMDVPFTEGEHIRTEISCKFTEPGLRDEYERAGLELHGWYTDPEGLFALSLTGPGAGTGS
jgi:L-histidine Nalpha-methyltransferase